MKCEAKVFPAAAATDPATELPPLSASDAALADTLLNRAK
jgi:hypothetical protein